jgi:hypothetical protein
MPEAFGTLNPNTTWTSAAYLVNMHAAGCEAAQAEQVRPATLKIAWIVHGGLRHPGSINASWAASLVVSAWLRGIETDPAHYADPASRAHSQRAHFQVALQKHLGRTSGQSITTMFSQSLCTLCKDVALTIAWAGTFFGLGPSRCIAVRGNG